MLNPVHQRVVDLETIYSLQPAENAVGHKQQTSHVSDLNDILLKICADHLSPAAREPLSSTSKKFNQLIQETQTKIFINNETHISALLTYPNVAHIKVDANLNSEKIKELILILPSCKKLAELEIMDMEVTQNSNLALLTGLLESPLDLSSIKKLKFSRMQVGNATVHEEIKSAEDFARFNEKLRAALNAHRLSSLQYFNIEDLNQGYYRPYIQALGKSFLSKIPSTLVELDLSSIILTKEMSDNLSEAIKENKFEYLKLLDLEIPQVDLHTNHNGPDSYQNLLKNLALNPPAILETLRLSINMDLNNDTQKALLKSFKENKFENLKEIKLGGLDETTGDFIEQKAFLIGCLKNCSTLEKLHLSYIQYEGILIDSLTFIWNQNPALKTFKIETNRWEASETNRLLQQMSQAGHATIKNMEFLGDCTFNAETLKIFSEALEQKKFPVLENVCLIDATDLDTTNAEGLARLNAAINKLALALPPQKITLTLHHPQILEID